MQTTSILCALVAFSTAVTAADLSGFKAGAGVEPKLKAFLTTYFPFSEDPKSTTTWTNWWAETGTLTFRGVEYTGAANRLAVKQSILPPAGGITWNHIITDVVVSGETATSKTYTESAVIEIRNTTAKTCSGFKGNVIAGIKKDAAGKVDLTLHGGNYLTYVLDLPRTPNSACTY
ncbi:hypothetical protein DHEL01_v213048 [Diaporthe helianthi]|uniref:Uncharacterized protein n=1 Tax=Diaporthe helianthi TaxID=158607 RepID=A0A2P5HE79_DIAHE|nr:hypothetical protein DHEL01_v213048 [Diaporthe helianthi]